MKPHPLLSQVFRFALASSSLAILSARSMIDRIKIREIEGCEQSTLLINDKQRSLEMFSPCHRLFSLLSFTFMLVEESFNFFFLVVPVRNLMLRIHCSPKILSVQGNRKHS